jgi:hypothetical protein
MTFISARVCIYFVLIKFLAPSHLRLSSKWSSIRKVKSPPKVHICAGVLVGMSFLLERD